MSRGLPTLLAAVAFALVACQPDAPDSAPASSAVPLGPAATVTAETARLEPIAARMARALADPGFRARLYDRLKASPFREGKVHLQRSYSRTSAADLAALANLNNEAEAITDSVLRATEPLEVYLPVPAHRQRWKGDDRLLVATAARDHDIPVAYDLTGGRHLLDPDRPPDTPVLAVVPVETDFDHPLIRTQAQCTPDQLESCGGTGGGGSGGGGGGGVTPSGVTPGLYMTAAHFVEDFEGWLKGEPEFEIHIMGQRGRSDSLTRYECAGEHQPGLYNWNGGENWTGSVLLFSQFQINSYKNTHPGETFRIVAMEDDDTSCEMKVDPYRWEKFVGTIGPLYKDITGAIDTGSTKKVIAAGKSFENFLAALASWIKTNDDLIGNAMEDKVVGEYHSGFNWVLRADNNQTNGWINLVMR